MKNRICEVLNIEKPVIQGPMAWISTAPLVAAVSNAGGLGVLGVGFAPIEFAIEQIRQTKELTDKPFAINVVLIPQILDNVTEMVKREKPPIVYADTLDIFDVELMKKYFKLWHEEGCKVVTKIGRLEDAIASEQAGADVIIAKGWEGGGHVSFEATTVLVPLVKAHISTPLVASGGIATGRGAAAGIALGAEGIEMGTVFMAAKETLIHPNAKQAVVDCKDMQTVVTGTCTGEPCRQIQNKLSNEMLKIEAEYTYKEAAEKLREIAESSLKAAMMEGDVEERGAVMVGQVAPLVNEIKTCEAIIDEVLADCKKVIAEMKEF